MGQSETKPVSAEALMDLLPNEAILEVMKHLPISDLKREWSGDLIFNYG